MVYNFLYRPPKTPMDYLIYYVLAREITINNALQRHFWWYENSCLLEELQCPVVVAMASNDEVAPAAVVKTYIEHVSRQKASELLTGGKGGHGMVDLIYWEGQCHAECLMSISSLTDIMSACKSQETMVKRLNSTTTKSVLDFTPPVSPSLFTGYSHTSRGTERLARDYCE